MNSEPAPGRHLRLVKTLMLTPSLLLVLGVVVGCASSKNAFVVEPAPQPPPFLNGPMALLLTNVDGFHAHVTLTGGSPAGKAVAGELMGKGGRLLFAPVPAKEKRKRATAADSAFIWNVPASQGYVLNDPLQAYAPCSSNLQFTNLAPGVATAQARPETISGHPCQPADVLVTATDGSITAFRVWRAADLSGLALRVVCTSGGMPSTLTLFKPRLEDLPSDLFQPPSGFTKYNSGEALVNEMVARQHNLKRSPSQPSFDAEPGPSGEMRSPTR